MKAALFVVVLCQLVSVHCLAVSVRAEDLGNLCKAVYDVNTGEVARAAKRYEQLHETAEPSCFYTEYVDFLKSTNQVHKISALGPTILNACPANANAQLAVAQAYRTAGKQQEYMGLMEQIHDKNKNNAEVAFEMAQACICQQALHKALDIIDAFLNASVHRLNNFIFYFLKSQIFLQLQDCPQALEYVKKCLEVNNQFDKGWLLFAMLQEQMGNLEQALDGYKHFMEYTHEQNKEVEMRLMALMMKQKMLGNNTAAPQSPLDHALVAMQGGHHGKAQEAVDKALQQEPENVDAKILKVQAMLNEGNVKKALQQLGVWAVQEPHVGTWLALGHTIALQQGIAAVRVWFEDLVKKHPNTLLIQLYLADLYTREGDVKHAMTAFKKALPLASEQPELKVKILYHLACFYFDKEQYKQMLEMLEQAQQEEYFFAPATNLLAYYYAMHDEIPKAQGLLHSVLEKHPDNAHYLDTQALVYIKQKEYEKAHKLLQSVLKKTPKDSSVLLHAAQIAAATGNKKEALQYAQEAVHYAHSPHEKKESARYVRELKA